MLNTLPMFDLRSVCLLAGLACLIACTALMQGRGLHRPSQAAVHLLGWSLTCAGVAMLATAGTGWLPARPLRWLAQLAGVGAFALLAESVRRLYGREPRLLVVAGSLGFLAVMLGLAPDARVSATLGVVSEAVFVAVALAAAVSGVEPDAPRARRVLVGVLAGVLGLQSLRLFALWAAGRSGDPALELATGIASASVLVSDGMAAVLFVLLPMLAAATVMATAWARRLAQTLDHVWDDEVTGMASRKFLFSVGEPWLVANERQRAHTAVLMIDVDGLKDVNAVHGHAAGDKVLRHVASVLRRSVRSDSLITRFGDAEFCALVPVDDLTQAQTVSQRLCRVVEGARFHDDDLSLTVTVSIGVAMYEGGQRLQDVLRIVESRTDLAKRSGRNCVVAEAASTQDSRQTTRGSSR